MLKRTNHQEVRFQRILEHVLQGTHMKIRNGITDITTPHLHAEIKTWPKWRHAIGQLLAYNAYDSQPELQVYLFNQYSTERKIIALNVFKMYNIMPFEFVEDLDANKMKIIRLNDNKCIFKDDLV